ncbi:hypothetical protein S83_008390 [Arachis hypogaea]
MTKNDDSDGELPCKLRAKNLIFRFLQSKARIQIWLFEQKDLRIKYCIIVSPSYLIKVSFEFIVIDIFGQLEIIE